MSDQEFKQAEELLRAIQNEPTINRIFCETPYYEMGGNFIIFEIKGVTWKLEIKVVNVNKKH